MKKIFAILLLAIIMCFALSACVDGSNKNNNSGGNGSADGSGETGGDVSTETPEQPNKQEVTKMFITINGNKLEVTLAQNSAVDALVERLKQGNVTYTARDYGGFEKVGSLGFSLPTSDTHITTQAGDVILYSGNQIVLFYGSNSWDYTRLGKINGHSVAELKTLLGAGKGNVEVTLSLQ